jgi:hypothetical protein
MTRLLIINQCHHGDQAAAMDNARLIADMIPQRREDVSMMFAHANGTPPDLPTIRYVGRKMQTEIFHSDRKATGWPSGPNHLFFAAYDYFYANVKRGLWPYDVALFLEADMCPMRPQWLDELIEEWDSKDKLVGGFVYTDKCHAHAHVNGGMLISPEFRKLHRDFFWAHDNVGFDVQWGQELSEQAYPSKLFWMEYKRGTIDEASLFSLKKYAKHHPLAKLKINPCIVHGVKDGSARALVRKKYAQAKEAQEAAH